MSLDSDLEQGNILLFNDGADVLGWIDVNDVHLGILVIPFGHEHEIIDVHPGSKLHLATDHTDCLEPVGALEEQRPLPSIFCTTA